MHIDASHSLMPIVCHLLISVVFRFQSNDWFYDTHRSLSTTLFPPTTSTRHNARQFAILHRNRIHNQIGNEFARARRRFGVFDKSGKRSRLHLHMRRIIWKWNLAHRQWFVATPKPSHDINTHSPETLLRHRLHTLPPHAAALHSDFISCKCQHVLWWCYASS